MIPAGVNPPQKSNTTLLGAPMSQNYSILNIFSKLVILLWDLGVARLVEREVLGRMMWQ